MGVSHCRNGGCLWAGSGRLVIAKTVYQDFLTLWKDADPDVPILQQAKEEYAKPK
jgi:hypothetical protein